MKRRNFLALASLATAEIVGASFELRWQNQVFAHNATMAELTARQKLENSIPGLISKLPSKLTNKFAWTIDDASDARVLGFYLDRALEHNLALTFFVNSSKHSWVSQVHKLHPLIQTGQIQLGNHCHNHPNLTLLSNAQVSNEIARCHNFLLDSFGVDARPFWRPPFRMVDDRIAKIAADQGYTTTALWSNNLLNASPSTTTEKTLQRFATEVRPGAILLDHMHGLETDEAFATAIDTLASAGINGGPLRSVTLREAFSLA